MPFAPGVRVGPYEIVSLLGAGGMGVVYRGRDARLAREVAIKVLPAAVSGDADRQARFEQEARAAAALSHPNIVAVFDVGVHDGSPYIVSELLDGGTLEERLREGPPPLRTAIDYAVQVARGLSAAHDRGIVHRDLKPANVFVTADGRVKILDFGLAKLTADVRAPGAASILPTTPAATTPGTVFGTIGYMAPEQVRGGAVDHRADIFAFGVLLYEMVAGERAFNRETAPEMLTAILKDDVAEPPLDARQVPAGLRRIIRRCLEKDASARFQSALDLAFALDATDIAPSGATAARDEPVRTRWRERPAWTLAALLALGAAALWRADDAPADSRGAVRFTITVPDGWSADGRRNAGGVFAQISADGRRIAFIAARPPQPQQIWLREFDALEPRPLPGTEGARTMFWSPDGRWLAFAAGQTLKKIDVRGGLPSVVCTCPASGGDWGPDGTILLGSVRRGILRVPADGGEPVPVTQSEAGDSHVLPAFIAGDRFLYLVRRGPRGLLYQASLGAAAQSLVAELDALTYDYADGYVFLPRGTSIVAQRLDHERGVLDGAPTVLLDNISTRRDVVAGQFLVFTASPGGLGYQTAASSNAHRLTWYDRMGTAGATVGDPGLYSNLEMSGDGRRGAVAMVDGAFSTRDIWTFDVARPLLSRLTFEPTEERSMAWMPDGAEVIFNSGQGGGFAFFRKRAGGIGAAAPVFPADLSRDPMAVSPRGVLLYRATGTETGNDIWTLPLEGGTPAPLIATRFDENYGRVSADGRWLVYVSDESGQREVYVTAFPSPGARWRVSSAGGDFPRWRGDGRELFYIDAENVLVAVPVSEARGEIVIGDAQPLFPLEIPAQAGHSYAVTPDGQRFLVIRDVSPPPSPTTIVLNWRALLP